MTDADLRDLFAAVAMHGFLAEPMTDKDGENTLCHVVKGYEAVTITEDIAIGAYAVADAMMIERAMRTKRGE